MIVDCEVGWSGGVGGWGSGDRLLRECLTCIIIYIYRQKYYNQKIFALFKYGIEYIKFNL
jgi:hypothetical protein